MNSNQDTLQCSLDLRDNIRLMAQIREVGSPIWLVLTHGIGEHYGRHDYLLGLFSNFNIFRYDLRGHGRSGGKRAYIENFSTFVQDLHEVLCFIQEKYKGEKFLLVGHSMGALITASYLQNYDSPYPIRAFLSAPPVGVPGLAGKVVKWIPKSAMNTFSTLPISLPLSVVDFRHLSHDTQVGLDYVQDEFNQLKLHSRLILQLVDHTKKVFSKPIRPRCPVFCAMGSEDSIVDFHSAKQYFTSVEKSIQFKTIEGAWHEMHNEVERFRKPYFDYLKKSLEDVLSV